MIKPRFVSNDQGQPRYYLGRTAIQGLLYHLMCGIIRAQYNLS